MGTSDQKGSLYANKAKMLINIDNFWIIIIIKHYNNYNYYNNPQNSKCNKTI